MDTTRRGNYDSGQDFVLEYGELRFTFNERDFGERCEQAALKVGFVDGQLNDPELEDLVNLVVNGEVHDPASALGEHVNDCWPDLVGPAERSLVHWLRRLVFRSAWLDQRVKEGELDVCYEEDTLSFVYIQPERNGEPIELAPDAQIVIDLPYRDNAWHGDEDERMSPVVEIATPFVNAFYLAWTLLLAGVLALGVFAPERLRRLAGGRIAAPPGPARPAATSP